MTNYIREMSGKQYLKRLAENPTVIIPTGACEIYGPAASHGQRSDRGKADRRAGGRKDRRIDRAYY